MSRSFRIHPVTLADAGHVATHRAAMFREMGVLPAALVDEMVARTNTFLQGAIASGEYLGWVACPEDEPGRVVAGAGVQVRRTLPFPRLPSDRRAGVADGRQAIVLNVYTEVAFRRQGLARSLMHEVLAWAQATALEGLVLHAAPDGRPLYEALGFAQTNEMRFMGDLAAWSPPIEG